MLAPHAGGRRAADRARHRRLRATRPMGRLSDATRWRAGRRRPLLPDRRAPARHRSSRALGRPLRRRRAGGQFAYYAGVYVGVRARPPRCSRCPTSRSSRRWRRATRSAPRSTRIARPARSSARCSPLAADAAAGRRSSAAESAGWRRRSASSASGSLLPWPFVTAPPSSGRASSARATSPSSRSIRSLARAPAYVRLTGLFLLGRIAIDLTSTMFLFYFTYWLAPPRRLRARRWAVPARRRGLAADLARDLAARREAHASTCSAPPPGSARSSSCSPRRPSGRAPGSSSAPRSAASATRPPT